MDQFIGKKEKEKARPGLYQLLYMQSCWKSQELLVNVLGSGGGT